jgi:hypothetical protein
MQAKGNQRPKTITPAAKKGNRALDRAKKDAKERMSNQMVVSPGKDTPRDQDTEMGSNNTGDPSPTADLYATVPSLVFDTGALPSLLGGIPPQEGDGDSATLHMLDDVSKILDLESYSAAFMALESSVAEQLDEMGPQLSAQRHGGLIPREQQ